VNRADVDSVQDLAQAMEQVRGQVVLRVRRQDVEAFMVLR